MRKDIYKLIAKKYGVTEAEVKEEMEKAIASAYENPNELARRVPRKGEIPTVEEFLDFVVMNLRGYGGC